MSKELKAIQAELPTIEPAVMTPMTLMDKAIQTGVDADQLEKLMNLQDRYEASQAQKAFSAALAGFQSAVPAIHKNRQADRYTFASFDEIMRTIKPYLANAGLSVRFTTEMVGENVITSVCTISHRDGHSESSSFSAPIDSQMRVNNTQKMGSANSYSKRYCLINALNLSVSDEVDDDGAGAGTSLITDEQAANIRDHIDALGDAWTADDNKKFLNYLKVSSIEDIPADRFQAAMKAIGRKESQS